jgi:uncharacterized membrane protein
MNKRRKCHTYAKRKTSRTATSSSTYTLAESINDKGWIVGYYEGNGGQHGFLDKGGIYTTIDPPGGTTSFAFGINAKGQIIGWYEDSCSTHQLVRCRARDYRIRALTPFALCCFVKP